MNHSQLFDWLTSFSMSYPLTFCLLFSPVALVGLYFIGRVVASPFRYMFLIWNRSLRARNIRLRGWPPPHLDADGDHREDKRS